MSQTDEGEKSHEATQKHLQDLRSKGRIPRSADLQAAFAMGGFLLAATTLGPAAVQHLVESLASMLADADRIAIATRDAGAGAILPHLRGAALAVLALLLLPAGAVALMLILVRGLVFTPGNLRPKISRISLIGAARQKFGLAGLVDFTRNTLKMIVVSCVLGFYLWRGRDALIASAALAPPMAIMLHLQIMAGFLALVLALGIVTGVLDYLWQAFHHAREARMTRQQLVEEHKHSEGDPHMRAQRRQRGMDLALNQMLAEVANADVVIVNPEHYAVALKWQRSSKRAPVCVAKGMGEIAARIRAAARAADVPLHSDPPTARLLHKMLQIGHEIRPEHYRAVAVAIRFAHSLKGRGKGSEPR